MKDNYEESESEEATMSFEREKRSVAPRLFSVFTILVLALTIVGCYWTITVEAKRAEQEKALKKSQAEIVLLEKKLERTENELSKANEALNDIRQSEAYILSTKMAKYLNLENDAHVEKAVKIFENTPLDLQTSSVIVKYSEELDVSIPLVLGLIDLESKFKQYEVGNAKDRGYCQIIPSTEKWLANEYGHLLNLEYNPERIFEPEYNIGLGMIYLSILQKAYGNDVDRILTEYNRGPYSSKTYFERNNTYRSTYSKTVASRASNYSRRLEK